MVRGYSLINKVTNKKGQIVKSLDDAKLHGKEIVVCVNQSWIKVTSPSQNFEKI